MERFRSLARSIMGVFLVAIATLLVSCSSGGQAVAPPTYSAEQLSQIAIYADRIQTSKDRLPELADYVSDENWANIDNFIHGPLGELRTRMKSLAFQLLPADKAEALDLADDVTDDLEAMSAAVSVFDIARTEKAYYKFVTDLNRFLELVPSEELSTDDVASLTGVNAV